jgi:hypothetical protein
MEPRYLHLRPGQRPPELEARPFRAILLAEQSVEDAWLHEIAAWIVERGSLYVIAWGMDCEKWHDSVDWAVLEDFDYGDIPDERFVMTTWHDEEPLSEAFWFAGHCATHPDVELEETIILHIAAEAREDAVLRDYADSQSMADGA